MHVFQNRKGLFLVTLVVLSALVASLVEFAPKALADASADGANTNVIRYTVG